MNPKSPAKTTLPPAANLLLAALPAADFGRLAPHLQSIPLPQGWALYESGSMMRHVYFPTVGIVSLVTTMGNGDVSDIALTGNEGVVGISLFMGGDTTPSRAIVRVEGHAYRFPAGILRQEFERGGELQHVLLRYTQALITQMAQTAVCNRHHAIDQQLCRSLLLILDRSPSNAIAITQEQLANMMGVRREGITEAAQHLQDAGLIHYRRGRITVLDRTRLEERVCECYGVVKRETDRLLSTHGTGRAR